MTSAKKCMICRTSEEDLLNLGEMKTYQDISAHYYCLLLASTIKQSGEDEEGILGFLPSDVKEEMKVSKGRMCVYCKKNGAAVICSSRACKVMFHLPCGLKHDSLHQFHGRFLSLCHQHRKKQNFKTPLGPQICPICYERVNFKKWTQVLWAPCCKKQSFFHKPCIQQMALSAGYFFKCPMCNNCDVFQKAMKHNGVFIPDRDASWELEPNAFEELLYRHGECNVENCLCKSGRDYENLGPWEIILCERCGSQGTHRHCSKLKKNETWICSACSIEKNTENTNNTPKLQVINGVEIIPIYNPSTSNMNMIPVHVVQQQQQQQQVPIENTQSKPKKRKRDRRLRSDSSNLIEIDSEDSDVVIIEEEPTSKCLIAQDRTLLRVRNNGITQKNYDIENHDSSSSCSDFMNLVITDVRSLCETKEEIIEHKATVSSKSFNEFTKTENNFVLSATVSEQHLQPQQQQQQQQFIVYKNNNNSIYHQSINPQLGSSSSSDEIVIID